MYTGSPFRAPLFSESNFMLEKYGKLKATFDAIIIMALMYLSVTTGSLIFISLLVLHTLWIAYKIYTANAAVEADRVATAYAAQAAYAEQIRSNPSIYTIGSQPYTGGGYTPSQPAQPTIINNTSNSSSDFVVGMALGSMMSNHGTATAGTTTVHHVYDTPSRVYDEPAALAPITSEQLDNGYVAPAPAERYSYGETLAPIPSEDLDKSSSSSSSWGSSSSSSDSSSSWGSSSDSSSSSSYDSSSSSSYDSGSSSSSSSSDW